MEGTAKCIACYPRMPRMIENHAGQFLIQPVFHIRRHSLRWRLLPVAGRDRPATHPAADFDIREKYGIQ